LNEIGFSALAPLVPPLVLLLRWPSKRPKTA
jgi:hypothetical protein